MFGKFSTFESPVTSSADCVFIRLHKIKYNGSCKLCHNSGSEGEEWDERKRDREVKTIHTFLEAFRCGDEGHPGVIRGNPKESLGQLTPQTHRKSLPPLPKTDNKNEARLINQSRGLDELFNSTESVIYDQLKGPPSMFIGTAVVWDVYYI